MKICATGCSLADEFTARAAALENGERPVQNAGSGDRNF
jgi:hypothetical protein